MHVYVCMYFCSEALMKERHLEPGKANTIHKEQSMRTCVHYTIGIVYGVRTAALPCCFIDMIGANGRHPNLQLPLARK